MRWSYLAQYCWNSILGKTDRIFSFLSIFSIVVTIAIFISLTGLLYSFKEYTEQVLNKLPLNIEVFKTKNTLLEDISAEEEKIKKISGVLKIVKRVPVFLSFYDNEGNVANAKDLPKGTTSQPEIDTVSFTAISGETIELKGKKTLESRFDESGVIVSFYFLQKLGYMPKTAIPNDTSTWENFTIPEKLYIEVGNKNSSSGTVKLPVPLIGVAQNLARSEYVITEDFYNLLLNWQNDFKYLLKDRNNAPLIPITPNIIQSYYIISQEQLMWLEENIYDAENVVLEYNLAIYLESWQVERDFEERLTIISYSGEYLSSNLLQNVDNKLRTIEELQNLGPLQFIEEPPIMKTWEEFSSLTMNHQYMQATVYIENRSYVMAVLESLRSAGLFASSPLESSLNTFKRQETFYFGATLAIFSLIVFLSGIVLFSTFYTSVQRKKKQIGLLKAIGASNFIITMLFMVESALITIVSSPLGVLCGLKIGSFSCNWINDVAKFKDVQIQFLLPETYILIIVASVFIFSWLAILAPIRIATKIEPAQAVR